MAFEYNEVIDNGVKIKVVGIGGGGNNAVNRMISTNIRGVDFIAVNTDAQVLSFSSASQKLVIGEKITNGRGAGSDPEIGRRSAEESIEDIRHLLEGADMVFVTTGMGGGTGTGAAPVIAKIAKEMNILTIGIVTKPFLFEGKRRMTQADAGIEVLRQYVDSLIVIPNERLKQVSEGKITLATAFETADDVLRQGVQSVSEIVNIPGFVNVDFADVVSVMKDAGFAHMGVGTGRGEDKAAIAATTAISSPLLETSISGATGVLVNFTAAPDISLDDVYLASSMIANAAHPDANIIWGAAFDPNLQDELRITIIATGFDKDKSLHHSADDTAENAEDGAVTDFDANEPTDASGKPAETADSTFGAAPAGAPADGGVPPFEDEIDLDDILSILNKPRRQ